MTNDWRSVSLGEVLTLQRGYDLPTSIRNKAGTVPVISSSGVSGCHDVYKADPPGVVTGRYGSVGAVFYVTEHFWPLNTTLYVRDFKGNYPLFVYYLLQCVDFAKFSDKTGVPGVNRNDIHRLPVVLPPLSEQRRIAEILSAWDRSINLTTQLIAAKQQRKSGLMQQLLAGKKRFKEFNNHNWTKKRLGDLFKERCETNRIDLPLLSITSREGIIPREAVDRRDTSNEDKSKYLRICKGDIGYNTMRMWQGVSAVSSLEGIVSPAYTICIPREGIDAQFMGHFFKFPPMIHLFHRYSQGLVDDTLSLKFDIFSKIEVTVPPLDEQKRIAEVLDVCDQELALLNRKLDLLKKQKQGLMQQLLTGRIQVKT